MRGDRQAFDQLVDHYRPEIVTLLTRRVPGENVDDILQEVWVAAWSALPDFDRKSRFKTWLYAIALNKCRDHYRKQSRGLATVPLDEEAFSVPEAIRPSSAEATGDIPALLNRLTDRQREVVELYYYGDLSLPEVAKSLSRNLNTVKYQFYKAHAELADMLKEVEGK